MQTIIVKVDASDVPGMHQVLTAARDVVDHALLNGDDEAAIPGVDLRMLEAAVRPFRPGAEATP